MGTKYTSQASSGYNSSPPSDDGTVSAANKITWATIKSKLPDPLKTFIEAVNTQLVTALDYSPTAQVAPYTTTAADHQKPIEVTGTTTISLGDAASMGVGYQTTIVNKGTNIVTVALITGANTLDGVAAGKTVLGANQAQTFGVNQAANGYLTLNAGNNAFSTGDAKLTFKTVADAGWVLMNDGSIGNAASGATTRANADTVALFTLLWANVIDTWAPVSGGRGGSAAADYAANKTLTLPKELGRAICVAGTGSGLTARVLGQNLGTETMTVAEMPAHTHTANEPTGSGNGYTNTTNFGNTTQATTTGSTGGGAADSKMQPSGFMNVMIKL